MTSAASYLATFELHPDGRAVLDDLQQTFGKSPFVPGAPDQTAFNCGARAVLEHILAQIDKAEKPAQR
jgi:hypothetical protein